MSREIERAIDDLIEAVDDARILRESEHADSSWERAGQAVVAEARARLLALLAPEPSDADGAPDWAVKALGVDAWNAVKARYENCPDCIRDIQAAMPVPAWETAARGVVDAILRAGWNISPASASEPSDAEIEAGAKALLLNWQGADTEELLNDPGWSDVYLQGAKAVLTAARAARQTGGADE